MFLSDLTNCIVRVLGIADVQLTVVQTVGRDVGEGLEFRDWMGGNIEGVDDGATGDQGLDEGEAEAAGAAGDEDDVFGEGEVGEGGVVGYIGEGAVGNFRRCGRGR